MGKEDRLTKREIEIVRKAVNAYRKELVDEEMVSDKTVYKDIGIACKILTVYYF